VEPDQKVYKRIEKRIRDIGEDTVNFDNWIQAGKWLDVNDKKDMTMAKYISFLRTAHYSKRK
jgi:hypothetical protein